MLDYTHCAPCGKRTYEDQDQAEKALGRTNAKAARRNMAVREKRLRDGMNEKRGRTYECPNGNGWHVTSMSKSIFDTGPRESLGSFMRRDLLAMVS